MNEEIKKEWVDALRSDKYEQSTCRLRKEDSFCCLGVLCDLVKDRVGLEWKRESFGYFIGDDDLVLPTKVKDFAGLGSTNPSVLWEGRMYMMGHLNDNERLTFKQIADIIESQL